MTAPVVLFVYKRYEHTRKVLEALNRNTLAAQTTLYIYADGAKAEKDRADVEKVRCVVEDFCRDNAFRSVRCVFSQTNSGLAQSVIRGVTEIIREYGRVIVLEDDLITSEDFLQYMNDALAFYQDNHKIWSISGYSFLDAAELDDSHDVYMGYRGCSWGWATWADRWALVDWAVSDYPRFRIDPFLRRRFAISGNDLPGMLDLQMQGRISSWAVRWCYQQSKLGMYTVFPKYSRIRNIGTDGSGTHSGNNHRFDVALNTNPVCRFEHLDADPVLLEKYRKKFDKPFLYCVKAYIKHNILGRK